MIPRNKNLKKTNKITNLTGTKSYYFNNSSIYK